MPHFVELKVKINGDDKVFLNPDHVTHATQNRATQQSIVMLIGGVRLEVLEPIQEVIKKLNEGLKP